MEGWCCRPVLLVLVAESRRSVESCAGSFDWWLPEFLHGARKINFGKEYADRYREEVVSKQGVSRPLSETQVLPCPYHHCHAPTTTAMPRLPPLPCPDFHHCHVPRLSYTLTYLLACLLTYIGAAVPRLPLADGTG